MVAPESVWRERLLGYIDEHAAEIVADLVDLVQIPSVSGTDEENEVQHLIAARLAEQGLQVDTWKIDLPEVLAAPDFPGVEVDRLKAGATVGRLAGTGDGQSLFSMLMSMSCRLVTSRRGARPDLSVQPSAATTSTAAAPAT